MKQGEQIAALKGRIISLETMLTTSGTQWVTLEKYDRLNDKLQAIRAFVEKQAKDEGLWFSAKYIGEEYLQQHLRELHQVIEENTEEPK